MKKQEKTLWNQEIETMPGDEMRKLQTARLKKQLRYNFNNSAFYRAKFEEAGLKPDDIKCIKDLQKLPLTTKDDLRRSQEESIEKFGHPYGPDTITCAQVRAALARVGSRSISPTTPCQGET